MSIDPVTIDPVTIDPVTIDSVTGDPVTTRPVTGETSAGDNCEPQQLRLLDASDRPLQHRLDLGTRRRGLAHVAEIRRMLAAQAARAAHRSAPTRAA